MANIIVEIPEFTTREETKKIVQEAVAEIQTAETLLSKRETCDFLGVTMNTLSKHIKNGTIPAYGIGSRVVLKRTEVLSSLVRVNK
jgi:excisionase family DNA binding protein